jgi:hypothetical protein
LKPKVSFTCCYQLFFAYFSHSKEEERPLRWMLEHCATVGVVKLLGLAIEKNPPSDKRQCHFGG